MAKALLVVDVQRGFLNDFTRHLPKRIARLAERNRYEQVLLTRFVNTPDSHYRRLLHWDACAGPPDTLLAPEVEPLAQRGRVFEKRGITGLPDELTAQLREQPPDKVDVVGIDTDMCVLKCAMDLFDLGIEPVVIVDCCASTAGLQAHLAGLAILGRNIGPHQLAMAGLDDGYLAAPP